MGKHSKKTSSKNKRKKNKKGGKARAEAGVTLWAWAKEGEEDGADESSDEGTESGSDIDSDEGNSHASQSLVNKEPLGSDHPTSAAFLLVGDGRLELSSSLFDLHTHSTCSDGLLSPKELVLRAAKNGVVVLALTDHDTMAGVDEAIEVGMEVGVRVIPGVELSATLTKVDKDSLPGKHCRDDNPIGRWDDVGGGDGVHILGYFATWNLGAMGELEKEMEKIRNGRFHRAEEMVKKLRRIGKPIDYARVLEIAGKGVAPARPHIATALVEAGHAESSRDAFNKYIGDFGPAYARGEEVYAEEGVHLIKKQGGVAVLAHPWSLKDPAAVVKRLKKVGLQGMEVYKGSNSAVNPWMSLADQYGLMKLGGSDFHGTGSRYEVDVGGVHVPETTLKGFVDIAQAVWRSKLREMLEILAANFKENENKESTLDKSQQSEMKLSVWLTREERTTVRVMARQLGLTVKSHRNGQRTCLTVIQSV